MLHVYCTGLLALIPKLMYCGINPLCVSVEEGCGEKREEKRVVLHRSTGNSVPLPQMCPNSGLAISFGFWKLVRALSHGTVLYQQLVELKLHQQIRTGN